MYNLYIHNLTSCLISFKIDRFLHLHAFFQFYSIYTFIITAIATTVIINNNNCLKILERFLFYIRHAKLFVEVSSNLSFQKLGMKNMPKLFSYTEVSCWTCLQFWLVIFWINKNDHYMTRSYCDNRCIRSHQWWFSFYYSYIILIDEKKSNYGSGYSGRT